VNSRQEGGATGKKDCGKSARVGSQQVLLIMGSKKEGKARKGEGEPGSFMLGVGHRPEVETYPVVGGGFFMKENNKRIITRATFRGRRYITTRNGREKKGRRQEKKNRSRGSGKGIRKKGASLSTPTLGLRHQERAVDLLP